MDYHFMQLLQQLEIMNKHKLDILIADLNTVNAYSRTESNLKLLIQTKFNIKYIHKEVDPRDPPEFKSAIRIDIGKITIFLQEFISNKELDDFGIKQLKDDWYREFLLYLVYTRLPIWKESMENLKI